MICIFFVVMSTDYYHLAFFYFGQAKTRDPISVAFGKGMFHCSSFCTISSRKPLGNP